ncbi:hypothetical protein [Alicyclobacillus fodiniaquatilis]|uniref:Uncharacterized protein n=1 Tax=Alicyclobacillus fodiniaquatilis TaxID=1661150 RepID=A0ABW4JKI1_9BACL
MFLRMVVSRLLNFLVVPLLVIIYPVVNVFAQTVNPLVCDDKIHLQRLLEQATERRYQVKHWKVENVKVVKCIGENTHRRVIYTFTANHRPLYGISSVDERDGHLVVGGGYTSGLELEKKLSFTWTSTISPHYKYTEMSGQINDDSIKTVRIKLGWIPLWTLPVSHNELYIIGVPFALLDMNEYNYLYAEGLDSKGIVIVNTRLTNLKNDSLLLYAKSLTHGLGLKLTRVQPVFVNVT